MVNTEVVVPIFATDYILILEALPYDGIVTMDYATTYISPTTNIGTIDVRTAINEGERHDESMTGTMIDGRYT